MNAGYESEKLTRDSSDSEGVEARVETLAKVRDVTDATHTVSGLVRLDAVSSIGS